MSKQSTTLTIKFASMGVIFLLFYSCTKARFKPDYEHGIGVILGPEECNIDPLKRAWFIQFPGPNTGNKSYGDSITYGGNPYTNVVKTYTLPDTSKIVGKRYFFEFYIEQNPNIQPCDGESYTNFKIQNIRIKLLARTAN